mgnify:FL=1
MQIYQDTLTGTSVSIQSDEYGTRAYVNSTRGRSQLEAECRADIVQQVYAVWGDTPTVIEPTIPERPVDTSPTLNDRIKALEQAQLASLGL